MNIRYIWPLLIHYSYQNRLVSMVNPDDLIIVPQSLGSVKSRLREVHEKLDRHRQLMDRYLVSDTGLTSDDMQGNHLILNLIHII